MIRDAHTIDELAFAIGALSHYLGDSIGHSQAVNPATADEFPKLEKKFGPIVTFEEAPAYHARTEFGFDVTQTAWQRYASVRYRERIGFRVARRLLYRAFQETYGISPRGILGPVRSGLPSYRWSITWLLPAFLGAEVVRLRARLPLEIRKPTESEFIASVSKAEYNTLYHDPFFKPGVGSHVLATAITIIPKIGRLKILDVEPPNSATEDLFLASVDHAVTGLRESLERLRTDQDPILNLEDLDLDTGAPVVPGRSASLDQTYAELLFRVTSRRTPPSAAVRTVLLDYYSNGAGEFSDRYEEKMARRIERAIAVLSR